MRNFDRFATWEDVQDMTIEEAIAILSHDANSDGKEWSARPHKAKAAQMAIAALREVDHVNFYLIKVNGDVRDILTSIQDAAISFSMIHKNRQRYTRYIPEDIVSIECWKHGDPIHAKNVWNYRSNWSRDYSSEELERLTLSELMHDIDKYKRMIKC